MFVFQKTFHKTEHHLSTTYTEITLVPINGHVPTCAVAGFSGTHEI